MTSKQFHPFVTHNHDAFRIIQTDLNQIDDFGSDKHVYHGILQGHLRSNKIAAPRKTKASKPRMIARH
jgi:hypothetical protein